MSEYQYYLAWLLCVQGDQLKEDAVEPPVPSGLGKLSAPLAAFVDFLRVDSDLIAVAAKASGATAPKSPSRADFDRYLRSLPAAVKEKALLRLARGDDPGLRARLLQEWQQARTRVSRSRQPRPGGRLESCARRPNVTRFCAASARRSSRQ